MYADFVKRAPIDIHFLEPGSLRKRPGYLKMDSDGQLSCTVCKLYGICLSSSVFSTKHVPEYLGLVLNCMHNLQKFQNFCIQCGRRPILSTICSAKMAG